MRFSWDEEKSKRNFETRNISFDEASLVFDDTWAIEFFDELHSTENEKRFTVIGLVNQKLIRVTYTVRQDSDEEVIRIISARIAKGQDKENYEQFRKKHDRFGV